METLSHAIGLRVICHSSCSSGSKECHEGTPHLRFELTTTVSNNGGGDAKARDPAAEEGLSHSFGSDTGERNSFRPPCKTVHTGQQISVTM